ncbi:hypothetical protein PYW08_016511 [Mythimna loreyi]|uniref:Uncharacterized protein n=1 Tax=Mythimna loreyi TaxID=667449 RepID=A0ACC2QXH2_9NEOP|nr:hypothetical protein PYW08_016511 [Mythimna loreyi]
MAAGAERFWSGDRVPEDVVLVGLPQGGPTTWSRLLEYDGCETHGTGRCGDVWGRPMSSSGRLSAELMMMMTFLQKSTLQILPYIFINKLSYHVHKPAKISQQPRKVVVLFFYHNYIN